MVELGSRSQPAPVAQSVGAIESLATVPVLAEGGESPRPTNLRRQGVQDTGVRVSFDTVETSFDSGLRTSGSVEVDAWDLSGSFPAEASLVSMSDDDAVLAAVQRGGGDQRPVSWSIDDGNDDGDEVEEVVEPDDVLGGFRDTHGESSSNASGVLETSGSMEVDALDMSGGIPAETSAVLVDVAGETALLAGGGARGGESDDAEPEPAELRAEAERGVSTEARTAAVSEAIFAEILEREVGHMVAMVARARSASQGYT